MGNISAIHGYLIAALPARFDGFPVSIVSIAAGIRSRGLLVVLTHSPPPSSLTWFLIGASLTTTKSVSMLAGIFQKFATRTKS